MALAEGTRLGPYEILSPIGSGGMGEVYRAKDTRLDRDVAVKVLPDKLASDELALTRFEREAKAVAALSHSNILAIYDVGTHPPSSPLAKGGTRGVSYVVTELLEGETLREQLRRSPTPWRKAVEIGIAVSDGLAAAHAKGIVHRDLKPENIFLTNDGTVKILDFGLARVEATPATGTAEDIAHTPTITLDTRPGTVIGTINYMSPEQVRGLRTDARSDIFAFGCVLYEMITGERAFKGETSADTITAILGKEVEVASTSVGAVGPELDRVIARCLEKKPERRFHSAPDLAFTLRSILADSATAPAALSKSPASWGKPIAIAGLIVGAVVVGWMLRTNGSARPVVALEQVRALAVIPFENLSHDPDQDIFVGSMSDAITDDLAKIGALQVIAARTMRHYAGNDRPLSEIAKEVDVDAFVTGSALFVQDRVEFRVRLIEVESERQLWSNHYQGAKSDILAIQQKVARAVANEIKVKLTPTEQKLLTGAPAVNPTAYDAYVRGRELVRRGTRESCATAIRFFDQAIQQDPRFALAHVGKARAYYSLSSRHTHPIQTLQFMKQAADAALALDDTLAEAHVALGYYKMQQQWDWTGAGESFERAMKLNPNSTDVRLGYALYLMAMKRTAEGLSQVDMVRELDRATPYTDENYGAATFMARRFSRTVDESRQALDVDPQYWPAHQWMGLAQRQLGQFDEAISHLKTAVEISESPQVQAMLGSVLAASGNNLEAKQLRAELRKLPSDIYVCPYEVATISIELGENDEAFEDMNQACEDKAACIPWLQVDPRLDSIRDDARFDELLERVGFEPQNRKLQLSEPPPQEKPTLAVLPFENVNSDPQQEYFSDGMTDELIGTLAQINGLNVISRQSVMRFKNSSEGLPEIARKLGAIYIVAGSVLKVDGRVRINVSLLDAKADEHMWSNRYAPEIADILTLQNEVALDVAKQIAITLTPQDRKRLSGPRTVNVAAFEAYLQGLQLLRLMKEETGQQALEWFNKAIAIDPDFALAYVRKSQTYLTLVAHAEAPLVNMPKAKQAALKAIELDDSLAEAHAALARVQLEFDWDWDVAVASLKRALSLKPNLTEAHLTYAQYYVIMENDVQATKHLNFAKELDPLSVGGSHEYLLINYMAHHFDEVVKQAGEAIRKEPNSYIPREMLGLALAQQGDYAEAIAQSQKAYELYNNPTSLASLGSVYATAGHKDKARAVVEELESIRQERYTCAYRTAAILAELDDPDKAFDLLGQACTERSDCMPFIKVDPRIEPLRGDPRYNSAVECVGLEPDPLPISLDE
jgi:TolB-like protein/Flp pilus assembly protein TadD